MKVSEEIDNMALRLQMLADKVASQTKHKYERREFIEIIGKLKGLSLLVADIEDNLDA